MKTQENNVKTSDNDVHRSNFNIGEMNKSRELYSREGDNSSQFEGKTVAWELAIQIWIRQVLFSPNGDPKLIHPVLNSPIIQFYYIIL